MVSGVGRRAWGVIIGCRVWDVGQHRWNCARDNLDRQRCVLLGYRLPGAVEEHGREVMLRSSWCE